METRPPVVVIGTAGHIDHGKSALVRALTGIDPDRLKEEQERGITIDLGFAHAVIGGVQVAFVDVPGHERFVRNMLAGAGGVDAVLLVVAATESVKPQTREHFEICRLLGVDRGLVALTKADLADARQRQRADADVRALVDGSFLSAARVIAVSSVTGEGLDELRMALAQLARPVSRVHRAGIVRLPVDRVFSVKGFGTVVTGTLVSGQLRTGDEIAVLPIDTRARVRGLQVHGRAVDQVSGPQRVAVNLAGIDAARMARGVTLATTGSLAVTERADVRLIMLRGVSAPEHGARVRVHHDTEESVARVSIARGMFARLRFERPSVLTRGDRLILRSLSPAATIGGAVVLDPEPPAGRLRKPAMLARFDRLASDAEAALTFVEESGGHGLDRGALVRRAGLDPASADAHVATLTSQARVIEIDGRLFTTQVCGDAEKRLLATLAAFHRTHPNEPGLPRETLRSGTAERFAPALFEATLADLARRGVIVAGDRVRLSSHQPAASAAETELVGRVDAALLAAGLTPPDAAALAQRVGSTAPAIAHALQALVRDRRAVRLGDLVFHAEPLAGLKASVAALRKGHPAGERVTLDIAAFKAQFELSRKHAIPLLEWLDRERVTRRAGETRIVVG